MKMTTGALQVRDDCVATQSASHAYKIMVIGDCGVGKTSLLWRFLYKEFKDDVRGTIIDKETRTVKVKQNNVDLELWDTAG